MKWYFSNILNMYISLEPLKISAGVFKAAKETGVNLKWDSDGCVTHLSLYEAKKLAGKLGAGIMSPDQYWKVHREAEDSGNQEVIASLESHKYTEFLDRVYVEGGYIDHPEIGPDDSVSGHLIKENPPLGRPGWILRSEMDLNTGHPKIIHEKEKSSAQMKYWSPDLSVTQSHICFAIRGYVTSVASISMDLGIPLDSKQPKLMLRLCMTEKPDDRDDREAEIQREEEIISRGKEAVFQGSPTFENLKTLTIEDFKAYIASGKNLLTQAIETEKDLIFTMGHRNPDSDTVISSLMESWRRYLVNEDPEKVYLPMIQAEKMPAEIRHILGDQISDACLYEKDVPIVKLMDSGHFRVIFVDQNYQENYQKYLIAVTDHHAISSQVSPDAVKIPFHVELVGSTASLIAAKFLGCQMKPDRELSRILYSAMLMDTENRVPHKMTDWDQAVMDLFCQWSGENDSDLYAGAMRKLLSESDLHILFNRDYKTFYGFGFAELKVLNFRERPSYEADMEELMRLAQEENEKYHFLFTLLKITQYQSDCSAIELEKLIPVFRDGTPQESIDRVFDNLKISCSQAQPNAVIRKEAGCLLISGTGKQISRKQLAPQMETLVKELEKFCYVPSIDKYICRDFLKLTDLPDQDETLTIDEEGRICDLSFRDAKRLMRKYDLEMLSLKEYWQVLKYAEEVHDKELYESMTSPDFLEYLDSVMVDGSLVHHPSADMKAEEGCQEDILQATPGLILPEDIDMETGMPTKIYSPAEYENKDLWRYWSPQKDGTYVFSRSYIFLIGQRCLDAKMSPEESCANMGIRVVKRSV